MSAQPDGEGAQDGGVVVDDEDAGHVGLAHAGRGGVLCLPAVGAGGASSVSLGAAGRSTSHGQAAAGGVVGGELAAHRGGEAGGHGQAEPDSLAGWCVTESLERLEQALLVVLGDAGSVVDHPQPHLGPGSLGGHLHAGGARGVPQGVLDQVRGDSFEEADVDADRGQVGGEVHVDPVGVGQGSHGAGHDVVEPDVLGHQVHGSGLEPGQVEQVGDDGAEPVRRFLDGGQQVGFVVRAPRDPGGAQGGDGGLDPGQRGAQVVGDGRQQCGAQPVALLEALGGGGLRGEPLPVGDHGQVGGERGQDADVVGRERTAAQDEPGGRGGFGADVAVVGGTRRVGTAAGQHPPGPRRAISAVGAGQQGRRVHRERVPDQVEQGRQVVVATQQRLVEQAEGVGFAACEVGLDRPACGFAHDGGDRHGDEEEQQQRHQVLHVRDAEGVHGRGEEEVQEHATDEAGGQRRPESAGQGAEHGDGDERERLERRRAGAAQGQQREGEEQRRGEGEHPAEDQAAATQRMAGDARAGEAGGAGVGMGDHEHVDVTGGGHDAVADARPERRCPAGAAAHADHDGRGVDTASEVEHRLGRVLGDDRVQGAAERRRSVP